MLFVKTFKGYEDRPAQIDEELNAWVLSNKVEVVDVKTVLSHENNARAGSGDLIYTVVYKSDKPFC